MSWKKLAIAGALWVFCTAIASSAEPDINSYRDWMQQFDAAKKQEEANWPGLVKRVVDAVATQCTAQKVPTAVLQPRALYQGAIYDAAVSNTGAVAVGDATNSLVLLFANAASSDEPLKIPLGQGFTGGSLGFSENGRFLAWSSAFASYVYDLKIRQFALTLDQFGARGEQWIGNDLLLIGNDDYNTNYTTTSLFHLKDGAFHKELLTTMIFGKGYVLPGESEETGHGGDKFALSDQFGKSFLEGDKLYTSPKAVVQSYADIFVHKSSLYYERPYRIGDFLVQPSINGNLFQKPDVPWSLLLRDGNSGKVMKSVPLPVPGCVPNAFAVAPDQSKIAMLTGLSLLMLNPTDLTVQSIYGLDAPSVALPENVALTPDNSIVVWDRTLVPQYDTVYVYKLKN